MASARGKEYEMLFRLNAQANGGFSSTFTKARAEFARLGTQIRELHKTQSDISSYQRLQTAADNTSRKLENLKRQQELLKAQIDETKKGTDGQTVSTTALEREEAKLDERIKATEAALEGQKSRLEATERRLQEAGVDMNDLGRAGEQLTGRLRELEEQQRNVAESAQSAAGGAEAMAAALTSAGAIAAVQGLTRAFADCVGVSGDFEEAMSRVEALSQADSQAMEALSGKARELGATTVYTARQSAEAMGYMAMAGWDAREMMAGMDSVIRLAAASGEDLSEVSDIVTDNLTAFGLTASDTAHFADVLATAATSSNTSVGLMGETFKNSASVAGALGYSIEDVAIAVGLMANSGVKGSRAGTALRNMFNGLLDGVTLTGAAFGEYEFSAARADGTMKSLSDTLDELRTYFDQMSEAERVANARAIAGERGYNGLIAILKSTQEDYESLSAEINDCAGAAERMASIKLDNLNGDLTLMKSAWEALRMSVGDEFNPIMRTTVELLTDVISATNRFVKEHSGTVKVIAAFTGTIGGLTAALTGYAAVVKVIKALDLASTFSVGGPLILGIGAAVAGVVGLVEAVRSGTAEYRELTEAARDFERETGEAKSAFEDEAASLEATAKVAEGYIARLEELNAVGTLSEEQSREYAATLEKLEAAIPGITEGLELTTDRRVADTKALREHSEALLEDAKSAAYAEYLSTYMEKYQGVVKAATEAQIRLTQATDDYNTASDRRGIVLKRLYELEAAQQEAARTGRALTQEEVTEYHDLTNEMYDLNDQLGEARTRKAEYQRAVDKNNAAMEEARAEYEAARTVIDELIGAEDSAGDSAGDLGDRQAALTGILDGVNERVTKLIEDYKAAYEAAYESVSGQYDIWDEAAQRVPTDIDAINKALESQKEYWAEYNENLETLKAASGEFEGLSQLIADFADGSEDSVNAVAGIAGAIKSGDTKKVQDMVSAWQDLKEEQKLAGDSIAQLKTDYPAAMEELTAQFASDVEALDFSGSAARAARSTMQAYIDTIEEMEPEVRAAWEGILAEERIRNTRLPRNYVTDPAVRGGYASGTGNAMPGWRLVGEDGPEIEYSHGGERVLNARETRAVLAGGGEGARYEITVAPSYVINGAASAEELRETLADHTEEIRQVVREVLDDEREETARRTYR